MSRFPTAGHLISSAGLRNIKFDSVVNNILVNSDPAIIDVLIAGVLERLLQPLDMAGPLADELFARAQQGPQFLRLGLRYEARSDQTMGQEIG